MIVGVTGNIGSGKSTVSALFADHGARVIEGDAVGRQVVEQSPNFQKWLRSRFGDSIFHGDQLDRAALGRIVFRDEAARDDLNREIWPYIRDILQQEINQSLADRVIPVVDAALIYEWQDEQRYDVVIAVLCEPKVAAERAAKRMNLTREEILDRYRMQLPVETKAARADIVLWNEGTVDELRRKAMEIWSNRIQPTA
ncbi:dephospho-CoA kinase [bacterium]|nr:dephospho-CoA kinase [bacterium]